MNETRRSVRRRAATTLVEVVGTLAVLLVIAVSAVGILGSITDIGLRTGEAKKGRYEIQRLARALRNDVHAADEVTLADSGWPIEIVSNTTSVRYQWDPASNQLRRTATIDGDDRAVDRFSLPPGCDPRVTTSDERVTLVLKDRPPAKPWIIEAGRP